MLWSPMILRLVSMKTIEKNGKSFSFLRLANVDTYETNDFMLGKEVKPSSLTVGADYGVTLDIEGKFISVVEMESL